MTKQDANTKAVLDWMKTWAAAIRHNDLEKGRALFAQDASGFGTITFMTHGLDDLVERQWTSVWANTSDYDFDWSQLAIRFSPDELQAVVLSPWKSIGKDQNGGDRQREGRATIVLTRPTKSAQWICVHTHFSMWPNGADTELLK